MKYSPAQYAKALYDVAKEAAPTRRRAIVKDFLLAVAKNGSLASLPEIIREFESISDREAEVHRVIISAPERPSEAGVARKLHFPSAHRSGRAGRARVTALRDVRLGGGAVVEIGDLRVDNSVRMRLERIRQALTK